MFAALRRYVLLGFYLASLSVRAGPRTTLDFDPDWRFLRADPAGAENPRFPDRDWALVSLPHTFNDTDTFDDWSTPGHRGEQNQWSGRTWYRKTLTIPATWTGRRVYLEFEAARQIAEVYVNGRKLGVAKTGFTPFGFDLTPHLVAGANVIAVMVDNRFMKDPLDPQTVAERNAQTHPANTAPRSTANPNLATLHAEINRTIPVRLEDLAADQIPWNNPHWHPAHGGLYRHVRLHVTDPLHISLPLYSFLRTVGPYAYATELTAAAAQIAIEVPVENAYASNQDFTATAAVLNADGKTVVRLSATGTVAANGATTVTLAGTIPEPQLWEPEYPHVYRVQLSLARAGSVVDTTEIPLGLRKAQWTADRGLFLNGDPLKLHGWGQKPTNEWPGLGAALPDWLQNYTLELMREAGGNFVRWGHCAAGPAQIEAGDRLGLIALQPGVDGESDTVNAAWELRVAAFRDTLIYFRNHPSILIWEGGNQKVTRDHAAELRALMDRYDPHGGRAYAHRRADAITAEFMDVGIGTEGGREIAHLPVVEGEYDREESPRRVWDHASPPGFGYPEAKGMTYQLTSEQFAVNQITHAKKLAPTWHSGGANWVFSDTTSGGRVPAEVARASGEVDGVRLPKEAYYVCSVLFRSAPQVHIIGHWSYPAGTVKSVYVASNADSVELVLNGRSLGFGTPTEGYLFTFKDVPFVPGTLSALASKDGKIVATTSKQTAGAPLALRLTPLLSPRGAQADGADVALFDVEAIDSSGRRCPTVQQRVDFNLTGPGIWRGGYNSGKIDSINRTYLDLEAGVNRVAVRMTRTPGKITLRAESAGLRPASASITSTAVQIENGTRALITGGPSRLISSPRVHRHLGTPRDTTSVNASTASPRFRFIANVNYTGPSAPNWKIAAAAADGKQVYSDSEATFRGLPVELHDHDWLQLPNADATYSAEDLIEVAVPARTIVTIAHDDELPAPRWLTTEFTRSERTFLVAGRPLRLFTRNCPEAASLTLGSNVESAARPGLMYVVFAGPMPR